jgi:probable rRNA maturation factor
MPEFCRVKIAAPSALWQGSIENLADWVTRSVVRSVEVSNRVHGNSEVSVVLSDDRELQILNKEYRGKDGPTNVLSFPGDDLDTSEDSFTSMGRPLILGDVVIAFETIRREAKDQGKALPDHLAHMLVHGVLHLCGFDHEQSEDAKTMESMEREILSEFGIADPYEVEKAPPSPKRAAKISPKKKTPPKKNYPSKIISVARKPAIKSAPKGKAK